MATKTKNKNLTRLKCAVCGRTNYYFWKVRIKEYKVNIKKFCKWCRKHTQHKEGKK